MKDQPTLREGRRITARARITARTIPVLSFTGSPKILLLQRRRTRDRTGARSAVGASFGPALPPPREHLVELGFLGCGQFPGAVINALGVQPHTQYPLCLIAGLVVRGQSWPANL